MRTRSICRAFGIAAWRIARMFAFFAGMWCVAIGSWAQTVGAAAQAAQLLQQGNYDQAIAFWRQVLTVDANNYDAHLGVATAQFHKAAYAEAQVGFHLCARLQPQRLEAYLWQGRTAEAQKLPDQALAAYRTALVLQPQNEQASAAVTRLQNSGHLLLDASLAQPFMFWQYYCVTLLGTPILFIALRYKVGASKNAKKEFHESVMGAAGALVGDEQQNERLSIAGRMYAMKHFASSVAAFKRQSRLLLLLALLLATAGGWSFFYTVPESRHSCPDGMWIILGGVGIWLIFKFNRLFV